MPVWAQPCEGGPGGMRWPCVTGEGGLGPCVQPSAFSRRISEQGWGPRKLLMSCPSVPLTSSSLFLVQTPGSKSRLVPVRGPVAGPQCCSFSARPLWPASSRSCRGPRGRRSSRRASASSRRRYRSGFGFAGAESQASAERLGRWIFLFEIDMRVTICLILGASRSEYFFFSSFFRAERRPCFFVSLWSQMRVK